MHDIQDVHVIVAAHYITSYSLHTNTWEILFPKLAYQDISLKLQLHQRELCEFKI